ncbi:hypothetical protein AYL99_07628 [Fonsecaea erecta]|uniref:Uncharacterized protein n=1 Tax=Fonsecaea erecta TaxID=1367422 RepID=A0A178ZFK3_9EURO|nr:hypothetical protein AYL99_07628 [Fonsecaea erecta]OAP58538.1 hypothetical protein AYL99_07628 [Fonsecaea erecta]
MLGIWHSGGVNLQHQVSEIEDYQQAMSAVQAWTLGAKYHVPAFQNALLDELARFWVHNSMPPQFLSWVVKDSKNTVLPRSVFDQLAFDLIHSSTGIERSKHRVRMSWALRTQVAMWSHSGTCWLTQTSV